MCQLRIVLELLPQIHTRAITSLDERVEDLKLLSLRRANEQEAT